MVYTQMLFALIFDKMVFGTNPSVLSMMGSILILSSAIYIALQKQSMKQKEAADKAREAAAASSGRTVEMQAAPSGNQRDEERGLMSNVDEEDEEKAGAEQNGYPKRRLKSVIKRYLSRFDGSIAVYICGKAFVDVVQFWTYQSEMK